MSKEINIKNHKNKKLKKDYSFLFQGKEYEEKVNKAIKKVQQEIIKDFWKEVSNWRDYIEEQNWSHEKLLEEYDKALTKNNLEWLEALRYFVEEDY